MKAIHFPEIFNGKSLGKKIICVVYRVLIDEPRNKFEKFIFQCHKAILTLKQRT